MIMIKSTSIIAVSILVERLTIQIASFYFPTGIVYNSILWGTAAIHGRHMKVPTVNSHPA